jgi:hypothetical protein
MTNETIDLPWETGPCTEPKSSLMERLRTVEQDCQDATNSNERVSVLIAAAIAEGLTSAGQIVSALMTLGYGNQHIGAVLNGTAGPSGLWSRKGAVYALNDPNPPSPRPVSAAHIKIPPKRASQANPVLADGSAQHV